MNYLMLVNKTNSLSKDYIPNDLVNVSSKYKDGIMKIIYGAVDYNAYAFIRYVEPTMDFRPQ